jgi:secreted Zn-dependent insulinase-like peptidase
MNFDLIDDNNVDDFLRLPYMYNTFDHTGIQSSLDLFVPENMWCFYQSRLLVNEQKADPKSYQKEKFYSKEFTIEELGQDFQNHLKTVKPEPDMQMGHPPENIFMPDPENLKDLKVERINADKPANPKLIKIAENFNLWFKQDDSFSQPQVFMQICIDSNDCDHPYTMKSTLYAALWNSMLH